MVVATVPPMSPARVDPVHVAPVRFLCNIRELALRLVAIR